MRTVVAERPPRHFRKEEEVLFPKLIGVMDGIPAALADAVVALVRIGRLTGNPLT